MRQRACRKCGYVENVTASFSHVQGKCPHCKNSMEYYFAEVFAVPYDGRLLIRSGKRTVDRLLEGGLVYTHAKGFHEREDNATPRDTA